MAPVLGRRRDSGSGMLALVDATPTSRMSDAWQLTQTVQLASQRLRDAVPTGAPAQQDPSPLPHLSRPAIQAGDAPVRAPEAPPAERFQLQALLGRGATGEVYGLHDGNLERTIAIKVLLPELAQDQDALAHLIEEARVTASLAHPNVLPVYDLDIDGQGRGYFSMKRIEGRSLGSAIAVSTPAARNPAITGSNAIASIFIGVAQALSYAHGRHIVHQDIKPDNIMLGDFGEVIVVDWGSAVRLEPGISAELYGTPLYMSPEQARNDSVDYRSDVYCIGASMLHALLLRPPTWSASVDEFWARKRQGILDPVTSQERASVPPALLAIALKALAAQPQDRYQDAQALLRDLLAYQGGLAVSALQESLLVRLRRWHRRYGLRLWLVVLSTVLLACLLSVLYGERVAEIARWGRASGGRGLHREHLAEGLEALRRRLQRHARGPGQPRLRRQLPAAGPPLQRTDGDRVRRPVPARRPARRSLGGVVPTGGIQR